MIEQTEYLPVWLYEAIIEDLLPWEFGKQYSFAEFTEKYTVHDSNWIGIFADVRYENSAILAFIWDACWLPEGTYKRTEMVTEWPLLFIKLESIHGIFTKDLTPFDYPREVHHAKFIESDLGLKSLIFSGDGGNIEIKFSGKMLFLALDREKQPLSI